MKQSKIIIYVLLSLMSIQFAKAQNLIKNGSFEEGDVPWLAKGDKMERHHQSILGAVPYHGDYYAELASDSGYKLSQTIAVTKGTTYQVSFYAQARPGVSARESHFTFTINNVLTAKLQPQLGSWQKYEYTVRSVDDQLTIAFEDTYFGYEGIGAMIDVVEVAPVAEEGFTSIFDGSSLSGWKVYANAEDVKKNYWIAEDGTITCNTMGDKNHGAVWLFYEKELQDFELKLKFQVYKNSPGNSGIQVRSRYYEGGDIDGPQFDIHPPIPFRTGLLYDESDHYNRWLYPSKPDWNISAEDVENRATLYYAEDSPAWNTLHIICQGTHLKSILNGVVVTDMDAKGIIDDNIHKEQNVGMSGKIALQVHAGDEILIRFKDILIKE